MKIYPYKKGSASARALADALGIKILFREGKAVNGTVINWGSSKVDRHVHGDIINRPFAIANASNKLTTFKLFKEAGVACPEWTESRDEAVKWFEEGRVVVARKTLNGHSGEGIEIVSVADEHDDVPNAPLYTKYVKKDQEYRIHVAGGEVIFEQRKARKKDVPDDQVNWQVRNLAGGFIFANDGIVAPDNVVEVAKAAVLALGLDFGGVDIITNKKGEAFALEVNTAVGLSGKTIDAYVRYFSQFK